MLYNHVETDYDPLIMQYRTLSVDVGYMLRTNVRLVVGYTHDLEHTDSVPSPDLSRHAKRCE